MGAHVQHCVVCPGHPGGHRVGRKQLPLSPRRGWLVGPSAYCQGARARLLSTGAPGIGWAVAAPGMVTSLTAGLVQGGRADGRPPDIRSPACRMWNSASWSLGSPTWASPHSSTRSGDSTSGKVLPATLILRLASPQAWDPGGTRRVTACCAVNGEAAIVVCSALNWFSHVLNV